MTIFSNEVVGLTQLAVGLLVLAPAMLRRFGVSSFAGSSRVRDLPGAFPFGAGMLVMGALLVTNASRLWCLALDPLAVCLFGVALVMQAKALAKGQAGT